MHHSAIYKALRAVKYPVNVPKIEIIREPCLIINAFHRLPLFIDPSVRQSEKLPGFRFAHRLGTTDMWNDICPRVLAGFVFLNLVATSSARADLLDPTQF